MSADTPPAGFPVHLRLGDRIVGWVAAELAALAVGAATPSADAPPPRLLLVPAAPEVLAVCTARRAFVTIPQATITYVSSTGGVVTVHADRGEFWRDGTLASRAWRCPASTGLASGAPRGRRAADGASAVRVLCRGRPLTLAYPLRILSSMTSDEVGALPERGPVARQEDAHVRTTANRASGMAKASGSRTARTTSRGRVGRPLAPRAGAIWCRVVGRNGPNRIDDRVWLLLKCGHGAEGSPTGRHREVRVCRTCERLERDYARWMRKGLVTKREANRALSGIRRARRQAM